MKKIIQPLCLGFFLLTLQACTSKGFIPLYQDTAQPQHTARLITPIQIDLIYHNGEQKNFTPPYQPLINYRLLPGKHLLGFRYQDVHFDEDENQEIITSKTVLIRFTALADKIYHIDFNKPNNYTSAKQLEDKFQITLKQNSQLIASSTPAPEKIENDRFFSSKAFSADTQTLFDDFSLSANENPQPPASDEDAILHLKFWWESARQEERDTFSDWINK